MLDSPRPFRQPKILYSLVDGKWELNPHTPVRGDKEALNFLIACDFGDWSGFRTLAQCLGQVPNTWPNRRPGFFWIEER